MPMYDLKCLKCGKVNEDIIIGLSEFYEKENGELHLDHLQIRCEKCDNSSFKRLLSAHAQTSHNWSKWQRKEGQV